MRIDTSTVRPVQYDRPFRHERTDHFNAEYCSEPARHSPLLFFKGTSCTRTPTSRVLQHETHTSHTRAA